MDLLITNIDYLIGVELPGSPLRKRLCGKQMSELGILEKSYLWISGEAIKGFGRMEDCPFSGPPRAGTEMLDASGRVVMPAFCDSHTHIIYAGSREGEFVDKIKGLSYEEIARRGGGILNSAARLRNTGEEALLKTALERLEEVTSYGTGAIEIKSGYGLSVEDELKMLRVIRKLKELSPLTIKATFLGAHAVPPEFSGRQKDYVDLVVNCMLPRVAEEQLAEYVDVFCDKGFFTLEETERIIHAASRYGLIPKIHVNEMDYSGGIQLGASHNALSVDHLEFTGDNEISAMLGKAVMPTILPGASFFLGLPWAPARRMIDAGLPVAMASDYNPGSSPSGNMQFILSLACIKYKLLPEEAVNAVTLNSAYAMGVSDILGSIAVGKKANLIVTRPVPSWQYLPYAFGSNKVERMVINGNLI